MPPPFLQGPPAMVAAFLPVVGEGVVTAAGEVLTTATIITTITTTIPIADMTDMEGECLA